MPCVRLLCAVSGYVRRSLPPNWPVWASWCSLVEWQSTLPGLAAVIVVLCAYAQLGAGVAACLERVDRRLLRLALGFGIVAAAIYASEKGLPGRRLLSLAAQPRCCRHLGKRGWVSWQALAVAARQGASRLIRCNGANYRRIA